MDLNGKQLEREQLRVMDAYAILVRLFALGMLMFLTLPSKIIGFLLATSVLVYCVIWGRKTIFMKTMLVVDKVAFYNVLCIFGIGYVSGCAGLMMPTEFKWALKYLFFVEVLFLLRLSPIRRNTLNIFADHFARDRNS